MHGQIKVDMTILNSMQQAALYKEKLEKEKEDAERIKSSVKKVKKYDVTKYQFPTKTWRKMVEEGNSQSEGTSKFQLFDKKQEIIIDKSFSKKEDNIKKKV